MPVQSALTPAERKLRAQLAAHTRWADTTDAEASENGRRAQRGLLARFEREVDPEGRLDPAERRRRALNARSAHMAKLALRSAAARRSKKGGDK